MEHLVAAAAETLPNTNLLTNPFVLAIISAAIGFAANYTLQVLKHRKEPQSQLSYDVAIEKSLFTAASRVQDRIRVSYDDRPVRQLFEVTCRLANTGNKILRNQKVRIIFPRHARILDADHESALEFEFGLDDTTPEGTGHERRYEIEHLERRRELELRFIVESEEAIRCRIRVDGDADVVERSSTKGAEDYDHVRPFFAMSVALVLVQALFAFSPSAALGDLIRLAGGAAVIVIIILLIPHIAPVGRVLTALVHRVLSTPGRRPVSLTTHAHPDATSFVVVGDQALVNTTTKPDGRRRPEQRTG